MSSPLHLSACSCNSDTAPTVALRLIPQGAFYAVSGLWSIVHLRSFEAVTGPKRDDWLDDRDTGLEGLGR